MTNAYRSAFDSSITQPDEFWAQAAEQISWYKPWDQVLDESNQPFYRWFSGGRLNTCYNALDVHIEDGRGDQPALIYDSPVASFKTATVVKRLPKTRSGKILRGTIQKIADNKAWKMPATIDDPLILDEMEDALNSIGLANSRS